MKTGDFAQREARNKLKQKYHSEAVDDYHRGAFLVAGTAVDAVKGTRNYFRQKKRNSLEKAKFKLKKAEYKAFKVKTYEPALKQSQQAVRQARQEYSIKKKLKDNKNKYWKKDLKQSVIEAQFKMQKAETEKQQKLRELKNQRSLMLKSSPGLLFLKPVSYSAKRIRSSAWQKAVNEDNDNDMLHAIDSAKRRVIEPVSDNFSKQNRLQKEEDRRNKLQEKKQKTQNRLQKDEGRLKEKKENQKKKQKKKSNKKSHKKKKTIGDQLRKAFRYVKNVYEKEVKAFFAAVAVPVLIIFLVLAIIVMIFTSIISGGGFTLGTYASQDYDLSEAEKYYTKLAFDLNEKILKVGDESDWKSGLVSLGANRRDLSDKPDHWYWGRSDKFNWVPEYDFDCYKLWSFLCAYYYNFDSDSNGDIVYWEFDGDTKTLLENLFKDEYEFVYLYDNQSRWEEKNPYTYFGGGYALTGSYYQCRSDEAYSFTNKPYKYKFRPVAYTAELSQYFDSEGYCYLNSDYRVLNPDDDYKVTGIYIMDNRYYSGTMAPFYKYDNSYHKYYFETSNGMMHFRNFWGVGYDDFWFLVSPADTRIWNNSLPDNTAMYAYYEKYVWKTDCRLYYNVKQKKTFDEAILDKLNSCSHKEERIQYYNLLIGDSSETDNSMYGNHQTLHNIFGDDSIRTTIENGKLVNGFGYDMQKWGKKHCAIKDLHEGIDVKYSKNQPLYAPFDCKVEEVDSDKHYIVLRKDDVNYWYDGSGGTKRDTEVYLSNANLLDEFKEGDTLKEGQKFATSTGHQYCDKDTDNSLDTDYVHIKVKIDTDGYGWDFVDPRLVFY